RTVTSEARKKTNKSFCQPKKAPSIAAILMSPPPHTFYFKEKLPGVSQEQKTAPAYQKANKAVLPAHFRIKNREHHPQTDSRQGEPVRDDAEFQIDEKNDHQGEVEIE